MIDGGSVNLTRVWICNALLVLVLGVSACRNQPSGPHILATVNGTEITDAQVDDELTYSGIKRDENENARNRVLEILIDRKLILDEAMRHEIDRRYEVANAIERAKERIIGEAYMKGEIAKIDRPSTQEVRDYLLKHPEYSSQRREYDIHQIALAKRDFSVELKLFLESATRVSEIADWLYNKNIRYELREIERSSENMPEMIAAKLRGLQKGQLFMFQEGGYVFVNSIISVREVVPSQADAEELADQYLVKEKARKAMDKTIARLRASANITYEPESTPIITP